MQADMVLEKELRVLASWSHKQEEGLCLTGHGLSIYKSSKPASTVTHFLQQDHTYSNKATPPNSATPLEGYSLSNYHGQHLVLMQQKRNTSVIITCSHSVSTGYHFGFGFTRLCGCFVQNYNKVRIKHIRHFLTKCLQSKKTKLLRKLKVI